MKFARVVFGSDTTLKTGQGEMSFEKGVKYEFPTQRVEKMLQSDVDIKKYEGNFEVPEDEVSERFGSKVDEGESSSESKGSSGENEDEVTMATFLENASNAEVADWAAEQEDISQLETALETEQNNRNRMGATEALEERIGELENEE